VGLAVILLVAAAALAVAMGGTFDALANLPFRGSRLVAIAVIAQILGDGLAWATNHRGFYPAGLAISALAVLAFCVRNISLDGIPLLTLGLLLNAVVVTLNGAMPVSTAAAARADVSTHNIAQGYDARHSIAGRGTQWRLLGDDIPVPLPVRPEVVSPGDVLVAAGLAEMVLLGMKPRRRRRTEQATAPAAVALR
jgi:hypothetical protein